MARTSEQELAELKAEVARLNDALGVSEKKRSEAEDMAIAVSQAGSFVGNTEEQASGKTVTVSVCLNPYVRDEKKQKFKDVEMPTYFYTLDLPKGAGTHLSTNGVEYYHGQTYEFDPMALADMKSRVARCWDHEKSIHGDNENMFRRPLETRLVSAAAAARGAR